MRFQTRSRHVIDLVFPIALFFVFAASALIVLILAADLYGSTTGRLRVNDENRSALAYIEEKIRQNDTGGAMRLSVSKTPTVWLCLPITTGFLHYIYL